MCGRVMMMIRLLSAILLLLLIRLYRDPEVTGKRRKREKKQKGGVCVPSARFRWNICSLQWQCNFWRCLLYAIYSSSSVVAVIDGSDVVAVVFVWRCSWRKVSKGFSVFATLICSSSRQTDMGRKGENWIMK